MSEIEDLYNESYHNNFKKVVEENKQLKAENEFKESQINDWIKQYKLAHQKYMKLQTENEKYKQCLDEIEEHIETCNNTMYCKDCKFSENCQYENGLGWEEIVLQKIKQVKEGGE